MLSMDKAEGTLGRYSIRPYQLRRKYRVERKSTHAKEPDINSGLRKFGYPHPPSGLSERCTVASGVSILDSASSVAVRAIAAVRGPLSTGLGHALWLGAPSSSVERHSITDSKVSLLENVDLATCDG